jgi:hypothetical protein
MLTVVTFRCFYCLCGHLCLVQTAQGEAGFLRRLFSGRTQFDGRGDRGFHAPDQYFHRASDRNEWILLQEWVHHHWLGSDFGPGPGGGRPVFHSRDT